MQTGLIFNVQRFSLHDGPGLRSTVFLKGCPLRCEWCHNPESQSPHQEFVRLAGRCMRCERCSEEELASSVVTGRGETDVDLCPTGALQAVGRRVTPVALVEELLHDRVFFDESGGGVTFSGGEPLAQAAFVIECLSQLRAEGVDTALDTCGVARWKDLAAAAEFANRVLFDLKRLWTCDHSGRPCMTARTERLRRDSLDATPSISSERARITTTFYREHMGRHSTPVLRAMNCHAICDQKTLWMGEGELIVGERGPAPKAVPTFPELTCHSAEDLRILDTRPKTSYKVARCVIEEYERDVVPFWRGRSLREQMFEALPQEWHDAYAAGCFTAFMEQRAPGHTVAIMCSST